MQNAKIIDADGHVLDRDTDIRAFMEEPYCRRQGSLLARDKWDASMYGKLGMNITDVQRDSGIWTRKESKCPFSFLPPALPSHKVQRRTTPPLIAAATMIGSPAFVKRARDLRGSVSSRFRMSRPQSPRSIVPLPSLAWPASLLLRSA